MKKNHVTNCFKCLY